MPRPLRSVRPAAGEADPAQRAGAGRPAPDPDQAWKTLEVTIRFISHADGKAGLTLASAGVVGGVLYGVAQSAHDPGVALLVAIAVCGVLVLASSVFSMASLWPRSRPTSAARLSPLYFQHIARCYPRPEDASAYVERLRDLTGDPDELVQEVGTQIWANSLVVARKFRWANLAVITLAMAFAAVGVAGVLSVH